MLRVFIILFSITLFTTGAYFASPAMVGGDVSYRSQYVWRGIQFNGESVLWPDLWINWNELTFVVFGSVDLTNVNAIQGKFTEFDLFLEYTHAFKPLTLTLGYAHYTYPGHLATLDTASFTNYDIN